jgi:glycosyltransferase involved in cell wall biosynthesis
MKILTNIKFVKLAGITQTFSAFIDFAEKDKQTKINIVGVTMANRKIGAREGFNAVKRNKFSLLSVKIKIPSIKRVMKKAKDIEDVKRAYKHIIEAYDKTIKQEKPDLILINGTYYMPWCLLQASKANNIPVVLHYHGVLTKETADWKEVPRKIFRQMEECFDDKKLFYLFPSNLTKEVVEKEVFGHRVSKFSILPNPVSLRFFEAHSKSRHRNIGIISRWQKVKNTGFWEKLADYNQKNGDKFKINIVTDLKKGNKHRDKLDGLVRFRRPMSNGRLAKFYEDMDVIVSPSHFETYGNVANEAIATGTPALISKNMGVSEVFKNLGLDRWIIDFNSVKNVYEKINKAIKQKVDTETRNKMKELYSSGAVYGKMFSILNSIQ